VRVSEELGVSRTPVREALQRLTQEGIVRAESRRGFFVAHFSSQDVREVYDVRTALEELAVRLALPRLTDEELAAAQTALDTVAQHVQMGREGANEDYLEEDRAFHLLLIQAANNRRLAAMMASLQAQLRVFQFYGIHFHGMTDVSIAQHQAILDALHRRDTAAAEAAMVAHIQDVKARVLLEFVGMEDGGRET
jgi:DNA-binding GntR family transcriptional regulator